MSRKASENQRWSKGKVFASGQQQAVLTLTVLILLTLALVCSMGIANRKRCVMWHA